MTQSRPTGEQHIASGAMTYRQLGKTQLDLSVVGFGASPLGDVFGAVEPQEASRAVKLAIDQGINFFDVSPYYGRTLAEDRLGRALEERRNEIVLATKCGRHGENEFDFSSEGIRRSVESSLRRLRTDYVDLLQAHDIEFGELSQIIEETVPTMRRLQEEGKARYIGITGYPLSTLLAVAEAVPVDTILSYCHYNLLMDDMDSVLMPFAERHSIGVINASPLHMRMLTERGAPDWHPAPAEVRELARRAADLCRDWGTDLSELALQFALSYPRVASTLVGMSGTEDVRLSLRVASSPPDINLLLRVKEILCPVFNCVWPSGRNQG